MYSRSPDPLFIGGDLSNALDTHLRSADEQVNKIPKDQFMVSSDDEIVAHVYPKMYVQPLVLHEDAMVMNQVEVQVDVSQLTSRHISDRSRSFFVPGVGVTVQVY